jgi:uncharacterized protein
VKGVKECIQIVKQRKPSELKKKTVRCPACKKEVPFAGNPYRPFCSRACKGLDLIHWASEAYRIESKTDEDNHDAEGDEKADYPPQTRSHHIPKKD